MSSYFFRFSARPKVLKCRSCHKDASVTAGTVMHRSKTNIHIWFWATFLVATQTPGISALELQKKFGLSRYETAFQLLHKLRAAMVRPSRDKIGKDWPLELDIVYIGGKTRSGIQGKTNQTPVVIAVEIRRKEIRNHKTKKIIQRPLAGRIRLQCLPDKSAPSIDKFVLENIATGASIVSDDGNEFTNLKSLGFKHQPVPMRGDREKMDKYLPMISRATANLKTWIDGTFHGVMKKHLQTYLNEFMFNRRFFRAVSFRMLIGIGTQKVGLTYREIYDEKPAKKPKKLLLGDNRICRKDSVCLAVVHGKQIGIQFSYGVCGGLIASLINSSSRNFQIASSVFLYSVFKKRLSLFMPSILTIFSLAIFFLELSLKSF